MRIFVKTLKNVSIILLVCILGMTVYMKAISYHSSDEYIAYYLSDLGQINEYLYKRQSEKYDIVFDGIYNYFGYKQKANKIYKLDSYTKTAPENSTTFNDRKIEFKHQHDNCGYSWNYEGDSNRYHISCLDGKKYYNSDIYSNKCIQYGDSLYCVLTASCSKYYLTNINTWATLRQCDVRRDVLVEINPDAKTDTLIYDTKNNSTRIVGFRYPNIYMLKNNFIYEVSLDCVKDKEYIDFNKCKIISKLFHTDMQEHYFHYYLFDWEGDDLYIIYSPKANDDFIVTHVKTEN